MMLMTIHLCRHSFVKLELASKTVRVKATASAADCFGNGMGSPAFANEIDTRVSRASNVNIGFMWDSWPNNNQRKVRFVQNGCEQSEELGGANAQIKGARSQ